MSFTNKVVLITGAGSGIGEGIAVNFAKLSATLSLIDINAVNLSEVAEQCKNISKGRVLQFVADISKDDEVEKAVVETVRVYAKIDVLINCAGISGVRGILDADLLSVFDKVISVNLRSAVAMTHFAAPALIGSKGCVVNIASVMARTASKDSIPYNVSKAGLVNFTRNAAYDLADKGVRVNSISPGPVKTKLIQNSGSSQEENDKTFELLCKSVPLQRNITVNEIAEMAAYLASDKAKSITGADFVVDSGFLLSGMPIFTTK